MGILEECIRLHRLETEYNKSENHIKNTGALVSVLVTTYQQVDFIKDCIEGVLMQITNFPIEIIIGEDQSTDGTREICIEYAENYPDKIRLFLRNRATSLLYSEKGNIRRYFNGIWTRMSATGKYIAWCEGDDYWTDPYKLQKQVDFLETNDDYGLVHTCANSNVHGKIQVLSPNKKVSNGYVFESLLKNDFYISTLTAMARRDLLVNINYINKNWKMGDYPMWLEVSLVSKIMYLPELTATYRVLNESASHSMNKKKQFEFFKSTQDIKDFFIEREAVNEETVQNVRSQYYNYLLTFSEYCISESIRGFKYLIKLKRLTITDIYNLIRGVLKFVYLRLFVIVV